MSKQRTIKDSFSFNGKGLHTGLDITLTFLPAPENHGIKIQRIDLDEKPIIDALAEYVDATTRGTVLKKGDIQVSTIEHVMSALYALGIDNCLLEVNAPEFPILDGSAKYYIEAIQKFGIVEQNEDKDYFIVKKKIEYHLPDSDSRIIILPDDKFSVDVHIGFKSPILNNQFASLESLDDYVDEVSATRTFVFVREIVPLLKMGLIKGGDLENAIVIYDELMPQEDLDSLADLLGVERLDASKLGYLTDLRFENEPARHKLLDVIGDLALVGKPIVGKVIATYPGHKTNTDTAKLIRKEIKKQEIQAPVYDESSVPVLDVNAIRKLLPHRWPFLLVDKVIDIRDKFIVGVKNVSGNETFFVGHFPEEPVMPGVLIVEAMAQSGGLLVLSQLEDAHNYSTYFLKIDNVKFRQKVVPGDTLIFRVELLTEIRRGIATMRGLAFVGGKIVCEAEFTAQIVKNKG
ncbi:bifunctional UDP-3-O-[3-hydroxymyristoyl] N-acetylglucosamine deacetylase/3-hydroxyacyl-ACP dehydratase [Paludibacter sp. 221]|uniref:bifunctional UDP-3-O-[3-hydroxymyristoyl] N-acetylglucosamine deacetylase/3-hydroxyacyl-ACP dehydratase n=1 Tax=Paludibacter sp. 221 TaxID=2302939 RepID=UPI0013D2B64A|nr:bifunctional UDP-3-O-[3-hydroxymyristoyl] N-acetylglucosamine deacetylase/3-hydroxyacyl-ACP dehydratase [Paludibacter sp. 221]NDV45850.1 bifunctional UDP-3-O-[3-hydroxymyristoyl] N-acetylglucosamine deacetylase/3-hydroxyacyl-ACP dehydratase [Paludibacter sp. 221]